MAVLNDYVCRPCGVIIEDEFKAPVCPECGELMEVCFLQVPTFKIFQRSRFATDGKTIQKATASEDPLVLQEMGLMGENKYSILPDEARKEFREEFSKCKSETEKIDLRDKVLTIRNREKHRRAKCPTTTKKVRLETW